MKALQLNDFIDFTYLSSLEASNDGKFVSFVSTIADLEENNYRSTISVLNTETGASKQLTTNNKEKSAQWLNDSTLLFISNRDKKIQDLVEKGEPWTLFYHISIHGGEAMEAFRIKKQVSSFRVVSERYLALIVSENPHEIDVHSLSKEEKLDWYKKTKENKDYEVLEEIPFWSNGTGFTSGKRSRLYVYDMQADLLTLISNEIDHNSILDVHGDKILYSFAPFSGKMGLTKGLALYDLNKNETTLLIDANTYAIRLAAFVGNSIVVNLTDMLAAGMNTNGDFYRLDGTTLTLLAEHDFGLGNSVGSDCRYGSAKTYYVHNDVLYFISTEECSSYVKALSLDGVIRKVTIADGSVDDFVVTCDNMYIVAMREQKLQEIYQVSLDSATETTLSSFNDHHFENKYVAKPKTLSFENNGVSFKGFVLEPKDFDPAQKYPAILDIHGGPKTVYGPNYYHEMQVWANLGYFVFFTNPTGSDGRGNAFMDIRGKYGTVDYDDLMKFTDIVLETYPQIDKTKVGVTGGSYGGFMTNWIIGHTHRFACAASQRSIANWISKFGTTDIGYYFNADQMASTPWDDVDKMWWHSPMKYADQVKTPTLFIHSEEDYRCWLTEGLQMFTSLKYHGVEARLCMFRKENHDLSRSGMPKHRIRRLEEITNWFESHLK